MASIFLLPYLLVEAPWVSSLTACCAKDKALLAVQYSRKLLLGLILHRLGKFLFADIFQCSAQVCLDMEMIQYDQGILCIVPSRSKATTAPKGASRNCECKHLIIRWIVERERRGKRWRNPSRINRSTKYNRSYSRYSPSHHLCVKGKSNTSAPAQGEQSR